MGDGHTAALVSKEGSIDWLPWPDFDSPSLFGSILDARHGGRFRVSPARPGRSERHYLPGTNVLETTFITGEGRLTLTDLLAIEPDASGGGHVERRDALVRHARCTQGSVEVIVSCTPRPGYGARSPHFERLAPGAVRIRDREVQLTLRANLPLAVDDDRGIHARFTLQLGEEVWLILHDGELDEQDLARQGQSLIDDTCAFWRRWLGKLTYDGPHRAQVERSALALKALIYSPTGAIVAAPTTSLPERDGGVRNWDYRFAWLRDACFTLWALHGIGYDDEAQRFFDWLFDKVRLRDPANLQTVFGIRGEHQLTERTLDHLDGYRGARPVRIGNLASSQQQLDIYGELVDSFHTFRDHLRVQPRDLPTCIGLVDWVANHWREPDEGIWEVRAGRHPFVHSKASCWVALDRGLLLSEHGDGAPDRQRWRSERAAIFDEVMERGFDAKIGAFVQAYDRRVVDAAALRLPLMGFLPADHPRMVSTVAEVRKRLTRNGLVYRYREGDDGLPRGEQSFVACTFWLVETLAMMGKRDEAEELFRHVLGYANDLGLYAEEVDPISREQWGNFPQAFSHTGLISAAVRLCDGKSRRT